MFIFYSVLILVKSISLTSRHDFVSLIGCPHFGEADFVDLEVLIYFLQCSSFVVESIFWTPRHEFVCFPSGGCSLSDGVVVFDPEARICFLQCASFGGVDLFDPEARIFAVRFLQWSRSL